MLGEAVTEAVLADWRTAPIDEKLRAMLGFIEKLTLRPDEVGPDDVRPLLAAGLSESAIEDAIHVCAAFNVIDRIADALDFEVVSKEGFRVSTKALLTRGYETGNSARRAGTPRPAPIIIEDGAWLGARSVIMPGVRVGAGAVIGASVVVAEDVPEHTLVMGTQKVSLARWR